MKYLFLTVRGEGEMSHGTVGGTAAEPGWHAVFGWLAGALAAGFASQGGRQILSHLLPLVLLDVVLAGIFHMGLHLREQKTGHNVRKDRLWTQALCVPP